MVYFIYLIVHFAPAARRRKGERNMFCIRCGNEIPENVRFCPACGAPTDAPAPDLQPPEAWNPAPAPEAAPQQGGWYQTPGYENNGWSPAPEGAPQQGGWNQPQPQQPRNLLNL